MTCSGFRLVLLGWLGRLFFHAKRLLGTILVVALCCEASCEEPLYPDSLLNWEVHGSLHALIVDKSEQQLTVWSIGQGEPRLVDFYRCATGEKNGDKQTRGDMKTPEGVYFFCSWINGDRLAEKYGRWAFATDYPNAADRARGKSGDGIWLHGRDKPLADKPDSNGCIALENSDLVKVSHYVRLQSTPLIIVKKMSMASKSQIQEQERRIRKFVDSWRSSWESRDLERFVGHYSQDLRASSYRLAGWKGYMKRLLQENSIGGAKLGSVYLFRQGGEVTAFCTQDWKPGTRRTREIRLLYITDAEKPQILAEEWRGGITDPFPVGPALARAQAEVGPTGPKASDLQIRLVGVDKLETLSEDEDAWEIAAAAANRGLPKADGPDVPQPIEVASGPDSECDHGAVARFLDGWRSAWEQKDLDTLMKMYHSITRVEKINDEELRRVIKKTLTKYRSICVSIQQMLARRVKEGCHVRFLQVFQGDDHSEKVWTDMVLVGGKDSGFQILTETRSPFE